MNHAENGDFVVCIKCKKNRVSKGELEKRQWRNWICPQCADIEIGLKLIDFIKTRISVTQPEDARSRFIFRELLQNADDVESSILVLKFEEDALYVANDGRAFTTAPEEGRLSDFDMISQVLGRHKAEDKETVGHFGSGFQTVYAITNSPEVHSSARSGSMNPYIKEWNYAIEKRKSPYLHKDKKGVLFRLPWRDDPAAEQEIHGVKVWEDRSYWPRWRRQERRALFEDLREYVHQAIMCCQHLKAIRLIWHEKGAYEGFQVIRNFCLKKNDTETLEMTYSKGTVRQGIIEPENWKDEEKDSFQLEGWRWTEDNRSFDYLIGERNTSQDGRRVFLGKKDDGSIAVAQGSSNFKRILKRGDLFVVFPLFDVSSVFPHAGGRAFLYSVIPLPGRGKNRFIFSAHFWPTEDRKDVDVEGFGGANGKWYRIVMSNVVELYEWLFDKFLNQINEIGIPEEVRQTIILNTISGAPISEWMRPGKESNEEWLRKSQNRYGELISFIIRKRILFSKGKWIEPVNAHWAQDDEEKSILELMGATTFTDSFIDHPNFKQTLFETLKDRQINEAEFNHLWNRFVNDNKNELGHLVYGQDLMSGKKLDKSAVDTLVKFCITGQHFVGALKKEVVPGRDGVLRRLEEYPILPTQLEFLHNVLTGSNTIHNDFKSAELTRVHEKEVEVYSGNEVISLIDETVRRDPARFENLSRDDHLAFSMTLRILAYEIHWVPTDTLKNCRFIPYRKGDQVSMGTLNVRETTRGKEWISSLSTREHVAERYQRDSIFGVQTLKVLGLTPEVEAKIRFVSLLECDDDIVEKVEGALNLVKLMAKEDTPLNFVRHFLSPQHESLFLDSILADFLGITDKNRLVEQKKQFQEALKIYFKEEHHDENLKREDMAKVPCLYDDQESWHNAEEFALNLDPELKMFGYRSLHEDLRKWSPETLHALGVDYSPRFSRVVETIEELSKHKEEHRADLSKIILWLLTSEVSIEAEFENVEHHSWVPTVDGDFKWPQDVLLQTSRNKRILGDDFGGFLDCSFLQNKMIDSDDAWEKMAKRARLIHLNDSPRLSDMLSVVENRRKAGTKPPPELFDALSKEVGETEQRAQDLIRMRGVRARAFGYYMNDKWVDSDRIRIMDENNVPVEIRGTLQLVPVRHPHSRYLMADGASDRLRPEDILRPLLDKRIAPSLRAWDVLSNLVSSLTEEHKKLFGGAPIYPVGEQRVCPKDIICIESDEDNAFLKEGPVGTLYILGRDSTDRYGKVLIRLGARGSSELGGSNILDLIRLHKNKQVTFSEDKLSSVLRLIRRIVAVDPRSRFPDESLWPAEKDGQVYWMKPRKCCVKDSHLSQYFEKDLYFLCVKIDGKEDPSLKEYAVESGCKPFSTCLKKGGGIKVENCKADSQGAAFYKEMANALGQYFCSLPNPACFEWLSNVEVRRCGEIAVQYSTGEFENTVDRAALISKYGSRWIVSWDPKSPARVRDQLTEEIASTCIAQGFPDSEREKLQIILLKLLTDKVNEWSYHVAAYQPSGSIPQEYTIFKPADEEPEPVFVHFETLREIDDLNRLETGESGYADTKSTLQSWYHACQICGNRTPADEFGYTTSETLKRVVCRRGGRYKGETSGFSTDNSVYLCPTHQVLWVRELVKFSELEHVRGQKPSERVIKELQRRIEEFEKEASENPQKSIPWECSVFEGKSKSETGPVKGRWMERKIEFTAEHLVGFLKTMLKYLEEQQKKIVDL